MAKDLEAEMTAHVVDLCQRHGIRIHWTRGRKARAVSETLEVFIQPIRGAVSYATALHELGHCLGRYQDSKSVIVAERWAWRWAKRNALVWTSGMERSMAGAMAWYEAREPWPPRIVHGPPGCFCE